MTDAATLAKDLPPTEDVKRCMLCGGEAYTVLLPSHDRLHRLPGRFACVRCSACRLVRLSPRPVLDRLSYYYPDDDYYSYQASGLTIGTSNPRRLGGGFRDGIRQSVLQWLGYDVPPLAGWQRLLQPLFVKLAYNRAVYCYGARFPRFVPGGRVLDVGCGSGLFLSHLKHHGWEVAGVDVSARAASVAKERFGIDVFPGQLEDAPFPAESFDVVTMIHSIEHLSDPVETLRQAVRLLAPGGRLYVETPNVEGLGCRWCGPYWLHWDAPRHLCLFAPGTLRRAVEASGLVVSRMGSSWFPVFEWESTYRQEEREGRAMEGRPRLELSARPRAAVLTGLARLKRVFDPVCGDVLWCWAEKPAAGN